MRYYILILLLISNSGFAQKYITDKIIIDSINYDYRFHHLEQYFKTYPEKRPVVNKDTSIINRGYVATFEIKNNKLLLNDIHVELKKNSQKFNHSIVNKIFPTANDKNLTWITGLFYVGVGEPLDKQNDTLHIDYANYIVFEVKRGTISRKDWFSHKQMDVFKNYQYERFSRTKDFKKLESTLKNRYNMSDWQIDAYIRKNIIYLSRKNFLK